MSATHQIPNMLLLLILAVCVHFSSGIIEETSIPVNMVGCFQKMSTPNLIPSHCMEYCLFQEGVNTISTLPRGVNITQEHPWFKRLQKKIKIHTLTKNNDKKKHLRKEYRYMTDSERNNWHQAVNMLKTDKVGSFFLLDSTTSESLKLYFYHIYPTPPLGQDMTQGQFLSGV